MSNRVEIRKDLERKRLRLAMIREEKERKQRLREEEQLNRAQGTSGVPVMDRDRLTGEADAMLEELGLGTVSTSMNLTSDYNSSLSSRNNSSSDLQHTSTSLQSTKVNSDIQQSRKPPVALQVVHVNQISIAPKESVVYNKSTQTAETTDPAPNTTAPRNDYYVLTYEDEEDGASSDFVSRQSKSTLTNSTNHQSGLPQVEMVKPAQPNSEELHRVDKEEEEIKEKKTRELTEEERGQIEIRDDYKQFIIRATKILERALYSNESPEIFIQYFPDDGRGEVDNQRDGNKLTLNRVFFDEKWSKNRCVTNFDWSAQYPELLLASYFNNEEAPSDPDGTILVWNMKFKKSTPEYVFHCQSPIMSCCFAKFHPSLIVGGTYSGQIALWDMRSSKKTPVQRSPLSATAHTHPVYCTQIVGTQNAHNLISISTDGKLCSWSLDMLAAPQETMELQQLKHSRPVAVTCMSFHADDYNNFLVGSEEGAVYSACRHGSRTGVLSSFESHQGPVTSIDYHPNGPLAGFSHLFLTSSIDWTVQLWSNKLQRPIYKFENNCDYLYDVRWSPTHPALFATVDGVGGLDIWNLNNDTELPTVSTIVDGQPSLNKLVWTPSGNQIVVGDDIGQIHIYDVGEQLATPKSGDEAKLLHTLNELKQNSSCAID